MKIKKTKTPNPSLKRLIEDLESTNKPIWKKVARTLALGSRRAQTPLKRIDKVVKENEVIVVPGKVLGPGPLNKKITLAALNFSEVAKSAINEKGEAKTIKELLKENPEGKNIRMIL